MSKVSIERAAKKLGVKINSIQYEHPITLLFGDGLGGWILDTNYGPFSAGNSKEIIEQMRFATGYAEVIAE